MDFQWPTIEYRDETMREGMQIESAAISIDDKVRLLDALGETGLPRIVVGSFVSPRYTPQMAKIEEVLERFTPNPDVIYTALLVNRRSYERARQFSPPLTIEDARPFLNAHLCDVFTRRNFNRSQEEEFASWTGDCRGRSAARRYRGRDTSCGGVGFQLRWRVFAGPAHGLHRTRSPGLGRGGHPRHERGPPRSRWRGVFRIASRSSCLPSKRGGRTFVASTSTCTTRGVWPCRPPTRR